MKRYFLYSAFILLHLHFSTDAAGQMKEEFDNLIFSIPQGFTVNKSVSSLLLTDQSGGNGQAFTITINKSTLSFKKMEKSFPEAWRESLLNDGVDNPSTEPAFVKANTSSGWNCFRGGKMVQYNAQLPGFYYHLTIMRYLGITVRIVTRAGSEEAFMQKYPSLIQLVSSVNFKTQPPAGQNNYPSGSSNQGNSGAPNNTVNTGYSQSVQMNTLYISVQGDLFSNGSLSVLYFFPDGNVFTDVPERGFSNINSQELKTQFPDLAGTFTSGNNSVSVKLNNQTNATTYSIDPDGSLRSYSAGQLFKKFESLDYYQLEGTFINKQDNSSANKTLVFYKDGRFSDNGLIQTIMPRGNESFSAGSGSYSSRQNSLSLQYSDGRQVQLCFYMLPEDFQRAGQPGKILINNYILLRQ